MIDATKPEAHRDLVASKLPDWVANAHPEQRQLMRRAASQRDPRFDRACQENPGVAQALVQTYGQHLQAQPRLDALLATVPQLQQFATDLLSKAISKRFNEQVDVSKTYLMNLSMAAAFKEGLSSPGSDPFVTSSRALTLATQPLLHSALQNFEAFEALPGGLSAGNSASYILDSNDVSLASKARKLPIAAEEFAALARELDIGGKYQALLDAIDPPASQPDAGAFRAVFAAAERSTFHLHVHHAFLLGRIDKAIHETLLKLDSEKKVEHDGHPVLCGGIELLHVALTGALTVGIDARVPTGAGRFPPGPVYPYDGWLVLYLPGMPEPLTQHASRAHAEAFLLQHLPAFRRPEGLQLLPDRHKSTFLDRLTDTLEPYTWNASGQYKERLPDPDAQVRLHVHPFTQAFLDERVTQRQQRLRDDGLFHAVPTATQDGKARQRLFGYFESMALLSLNVTALFIPPLGAVMLGVTAAQLLNEAFEGIESWLDRDRQQAFDYLMDVIDNVAIMAALTATAMAQGRPVVERIPVETPSFIEALEPVALPGGERRLWRPDLAPFAHDKVLTAGLKPDEFGLFHHDGKTWLPIENRVFSVRQTGNGYHLEHPARATGYQPPALHNGAGAWLLPTEQPRSWAGMRLFRRLGHLQASFSEAATAQILRVSGTDEHMLRNVLSHSQRLPALLEDTMERFALDQHIQQVLPEASVMARSAEFSRRTQAIINPLTPRAALLRRVYPKLPATLCEELARSASYAEQRMLTAGKVPNRLAEEVRLYQQHVRLARAYEGLYLRSARNWDSDRLALRMLERLPGWPDDLRVELNQRQVSPAQTDSIGPVGSSRRLSINSAWAGYLQTPSADTPDEQIRTHDSLYAAVFEALTGSHKSALGIESAAALYERVQNAPLLSRAELRNVLHMQPAVFRSPMRLADGRLGYRLSGDGKLAERPSRSILLSQLDEMTLAPEFAVSSERVLVALETAGRSPGQIQARIEQLRAEHQALRQSLDEAFSGPGQIAGLGASRANRQEIEMALWQHWIHSAVPELDESPGVLRLSRMFIAEFPRQLPDFIGLRVSRLQLDNIVLDHSNDGALAWTDFEAQLSNVFRHFPNLLALEIGRDYNTHAGASGFANSLPLIVSSFPQLDELRLINQNLTLYPLDLERFAAREQLRYLDLSGNRLAPLTRFSFPDWYLDYLGLDRMALEQWPQWLDEAALERIGTLSLRHNNLTWVPTLLVNNAESLNTQTQVLLEGNALRPAQLLDMHRSQTSLRRRFGFSFGHTLVIEQYQALRDDLEQWSMASTSSAAPDDQAASARARIAQSTLDFWERRAREDTLSPWNLDDFRLEDFPPSLPAFFIRCADIVRLTRMQATAEQLDQWLERFTHITHLTLDGHVQPLSRLPEALTQLPALSRLSVINQGLVIDNQAMRVIARMPALREVDISGNRLSPELRSLNGMAPRLDRLALRNIGLESWPDWLDNLMPRYTLDLRENLLTALPQPILDNPQSTFGSVAILLTDNPLTTETMRTAHLSQRYDRSYTFDMDLPFDILNALPGGIEPDGAFGSSLGSLGSLGSTGSTGSYHHHGFAPWAPMLALDADPWLEDAGSLRAPRNAQWQQLRQAGDADNLLQLITQLTTAVPYRNTETRAGITERVWRVLAITASQPDEREVFDAIAAEAIREGTCPDGILLQFQQVEQMCMIVQAVLDTTGADRESRLYRLLRRHFRQERLDEIASSRSLHQDAAEVRLAYRRLLATRLDLLTPADEMMFGADVSSMDATDAALRIWEQEEGEDFLTFAGITPFWTDYLREAYAEAFDRIETKFQSAVNNLQYDQPEASLDELEAPTRALEAGRDQQVANLIAELTMRIRAEHQ
ncbi:MAG: NEL-type E3 ubiquitin ligase domain-containing protein [Candidatus Pseudomonas phytovorans]|uniref:RING-type E3 ubiquitin transferase n=1 Tax=Candidatus Pseudomonas phytovorans TaxID=3121377 RepID=A0AAJ5WMP6_9PSED|nr:DUF6543 domain-containing protein [Pseudomonas sp.]WEK31395.1 MAG: NEL-type E3 ubiquitin ligase domain-containing protein [Pseudomonas sp.]